MIEYKSSRDLESFSRFLDSGGELPAEEPPEEPAAPLSVGISVPWSRVSGQVLRTVG